MSLYFEKARVEDARALTMVQKHAFDDDAKRFMGKSVGCGPPGYSSLKWNINMIKRGMYYKIRLDDYTIVGGFIISSKDNKTYNLDRIFIEPEYQNQGIGTKSLEFIENNYVDVNKWILDTPKYCYRNHIFYEKNGYQKVGESGELYLYEKTI
ncbi:GNAT family N-acetyltransferase [Oceanirhabdus seepicola]|uniref:GNAT family N-acetyltransferase n=1 Tax=Oceanirhabdus seepicola TaxID=2828781 RepID=A0A9J6NZG4_9CLOT|nr:GNAT family N-acetyltransferase [Oceanirhabdus seepicola]MCM1989468.1 GNAT family N-acetyltransferase [Oceanirhabdus seepicola]